MLICAIKYTRTAIICLQGQVAVFARVRCSWQREASWPLACWMGDCLDLFSIFFYCSVGGPECVDPFVISPGMLARYLFCFHPAVGGLLPVSLRHFHFGTCGDRSPEAVVGAGDSFLGGASSSRRRWLLLFLASDGWAGRLSGCCV